MDFKTATDELLSCISHHQLADALGCSVSTIRQARLSETAHARRAPPKDWEARIAALAQEKSEHFRELAAKLRG